MNHSVFGTVLALACTSSIIPADPKQDLPAYTSLVDPSLAETWNGEGAAHVRFVQTMAWGTGPNSNLLASAGYTYGGNYGGDANDIKIWHVPTHTLAVSHKLNSSDHITSLAWSPNGRYLAVTLADERHVNTDIKLFKVSSLQNRPAISLDPIAVPPIPEGYDLCYLETPICWSPDGTRLLAVITNTLNCQHAILNLTTNSWEKEAQRIDSIPRSIFWTGECSDLLLQSVNNPTVHAPRDLSLLQSFVPLNSDENRRAIGNCHTFSIDAGHLRLAAEYRRQEPGPGAWLWSVYNQNHWNPQTCRHTCTIVLYNMMSGAVLDSFPGSMPQFCPYEPKLLAYLKTHPRENQAPATTFYIRDLEAHTEWFIKTPSPPQLLTWSEDGTCIACALAGGQIVVYDTSSLLVDKHFYAMNAQLGKRKRKQRGELEKSEDGRIETKKRKFLPKAPKKALLTTSEALPEDL